MLIAGPNLTIDRTIRLAELRPGEVVRATDVDLAAGGKGVNVVKFARLLGGEAELVAFLPSGRTGQVVDTWLGEAGVVLHAVPIPGEVRSTAIMLEDSGRTTVLNEPGPAAPEEAWASYADAVGRQLGGHRVLACSGSTPPGSPDDAYARLVALASAAGVLSIVDGSGAALARSLQAGPDLVTPNLAEAEEVLTGGGVDLVDSDEADRVDRSKHAAHELVARGAKAAIVTCAAAGLALAAVGEEPWYAAPGVEVRNGVGAGDALVAGLGGAVEAGAPLDDAIRAGMAAAAASVEQPAPGRLDPARQAELRLALTA